MDEFKKLSFVYHYLKPAALDSPYAVWKEESDSGFNSDNVKSERALNGIIDFYTQTECDTKLDDIEKALDSMGATWTLTSVQFEDDTDLIHYSWDWSVT